MTITAGCFAELMNYTNGLNDLIKVGGRVKITPVRPKKLNNK